MDVQNLLIANVLGKKYYLEQLHRSSLENVQRVQAFCEANPDYFELLEGRTVQPDLAIQLFEEVPPKYDAKTKYMLGVVEEMRQPLHALIDLLPHFPNQQTWAWGLLLIAQPLRRSGLGASIYRTLEPILANEGIQKIRLGVIQENEKALRFWQKMGFQSTGITRQLTFGQQEKTVLVFDKKITK